MDVVSITAKGVTISLTKSELIFLNNAINETLNAVEDWEFQTRTGWTTQEANQLMFAIQKSLKSIPKV